jgi:Ca-activated chloride channel family protein
MEWRIRITLVLALILSAVLCHGTERVVIVLDASVGMWEPFQTGTPRHVAVRDAVGTLIESLTVQQQQLELGLHTIGGRSDITVDFGCEDTDTLVETGPIEPWQWTTALAGVDPRGGRALVQAIEKAAESFTAKGGEGRIVVLTSGGDQCHREIFELLDSLSGEESPIDVRIIGLGMDQELADSLILSTKTRNVNDPKKLIDTLWWGVLPTKAYSPRKEWLELRVSHGGTPVAEATLRMEDPASGEEIVTAITDGEARIRIPLGVHRARIEGPQGGAIDLAGIAHFGNRQELALSDSPPVTLEVIPERPLAGDVAYVQYWGAETGVNWLGVAVAGADAGQYIARAAAPEAAGEVALQLPDSPNRLEMQFTREIGPGLHQLLGRVPFETSRRTISIEAPEKVEKGSQVKLGWAGEVLLGDHITFTLSEADSADAALCVSAIGQSPIAVTAPSVAGEYIVRYHSRRGRPLARADLEVFEILATLDGPLKIGPGADFAVGWTGPDADQDFVSIAATNDDDHDYRSFSLTAAGNPALLTAPKTPGDYELRYIRASDGTVLARKQLAVVAIEITLEVPAVVDAGTRFEVEWTGTAGDGDFVSVAIPGSETKKHLDWSYASLGSPLTLAAPFEPGQYVVRYVSGETQKVISRQPFRVR